MWLCKSKGFHNSFLRVIARHMYINQTQWDIIGRTIELHLPRKSILWTNSICLILAGTIPWNGGDPQKVSCVTEVTGTREWCSSDEDVWTARHTSTNQSSGIWPRNYTKRSMSWLCQPLSLNPSHLEFLYTKGLLHISSRSYEILLVFLWTKYKIFHKR